MDRRAPGRQQLARGLVTGGGPTHRALPGPTNQISPEATLTVAVARERTDSQPEPVPSGAGPELELCHCQCHLFRVSSRFRLLFVILPRLLSLYSLHILDSERQRPCEIYLRTRRTFAIRTQTKDKTNFDPSVGRWI